MTVHVVIPVFNRLLQTKTIVACLRNQRLNQPMRICIVNDGSTDDTAIWLSKQTDIQTLNGDGSLFWGGAVGLSFKHLRAYANLDDWVLLMNNDTTVAEDFVQNLLDIAQENAPAVVGCIVCRSDDNTSVLSVGVDIDAWKLLTCDILKKNDYLGYENKIILEAAALSGRGVLYPYTAIVASGGMRPKLLPHYLADYDLSLRVKKLGWRLLLSFAVPVYSEPNFGSSKRFANLHEKFFHVSSPSYLPALIFFWWEASTWPQRITLPLRLILYLVNPKFRRPQI